jgi:hypothetical protein
MVTVPQKLAGDLPFATPDFENVRPDRNVRFEKSERFPRWHVARAVCDEIRHPSSTA